MMDSLERANTLHGRSSSAGSRGLARAGASGKSLALLSESLRVELAELDATAEAGTASEVRALRGRDERAEGCES